MARSQDLLDDVSNLPVTLAGPETRNPTVAVRDPSLDVVATCEPARPLSTSIQGLSATTTAFGPHEIQLRVKGRGGMLAGLLPLHEGLQPKFVAAQALWEAYTHAEGDLIQVGAVNRLRQPPMLRPQT